MDKIDLIRGSDGVFYPHLPGYDTQPTHRIPVETWKRYSEARRTAELLHEMIVVTGEIRG